MADNEEVSVDFAGQTKARDDKVRNLLIKNDRANALIASLEDAPLGCKDAQVKKQSADIVASVLSTTKDNEIAGLVEKLDNNQLDILMKYIYKCLESGEQNSVPLFKWHKEVLDKAGMGSIIRVLTERKTL